MLAIYCLDLREFVDRFNLFQSFLAQFRDRNGHVNYLFFGLILTVSPPMRMSLSTEADFSRRRFRSDEAGIAPAGNAVGNCGYIGGPVGGG